MKNGHCIFELRVFGSTFNFMTEAEVEEHLVGEVVALTSEA